MENRIIIYSGSNCVHCKIVKKFMNDNKIAYEDRSIDNEDYKNELLNKGFMSIPVLVVNEVYSAVNSNNFIGVLKDVL